MNTSPLTSSISIHRACPDEIKICQQIRHRVYVEELGFESASASRLEEDRDDDRSEHLLLRRDDTGDPLGCVRVILPAPGRPLPCLTHASLDAGDAWLENHRLGEISRLTCLKEGRGQYLEGALPASMGTLLIMGAYLVFLHHPLDYLLCLTTPDTVKLIHFSGKQMIPSGPPVAFRGTRQLYWAARSLPVLPPSAAKEVLLRLHDQIYPGAPLPLELAQLDRPRQEGLRLGGSC